MEKLSEKMESQQMALNHIMDRLEVMESVREVHISEPKTDVWMDESVTPFNHQEEDVVYLVNKTDHTPPSVSPRVSSPPLPPRTPVPRPLVVADVVDADVVDAADADVVDAADADAVVSVQPAIAIIVDPLSDEEHEIEEEEEEKPSHEDEPDIEEEEEALVVKAEANAEVIEVVPVVPVVPVVEVVEEEVVEEEVVEEEVVEEEVVEEEAVEEEAVEEEAVEEEAVEEEAVEEEAVEEEAVEEEGEELEELVYQGVTYYKDADGFLYLMEESGELSETAIGYWKEKTQTVAFYRKK
jgi:hypothetical protein